MSNEEMKNDFESKLEKHIQRSIECSIRECSIEFGFSSSNALINNHTREEVHQAFKALETKLLFRLVELDYEDIVVLREEIFSSNEIRIVRFCSENKEWRFDSENAAKNFLDGFSDKFVIVFHLGGRSNNIRLNDYAYHLLNDETSILLIHGMQGHYSSQYRRILLDFLREKKNAGERLINFVEAFVLVNPPIDPADLYQILEEDGKSQFLFISQ